MLILPFISVFSRDEVNRRAVGTSLVSQRRRRRRTSSLMINRQISLIITSPMAKEGFHRPNPSSDLPVHSNRDSLKTRDTNRSIDSTDLIDLCPPLFNIGKVRSRLFICRFETLAILSVSLDVSQDFVEQLNELSSKQHRRQYSGVHHLNVLATGSSPHDHRENNAGDVSADQTSKEEEILEKSRQMIEQSDAKNELLAEQVSCNSSRLVSLLCVFLSRPRSSNRHDKEVRSIRICIVMPLVHPCIHLLPNRTKARPLDCIR